MVHPFALLFLLLQAVVALTPAQGVIVCLGSLGTAGSAEAQDRKAETEAPTCGCGHHDAESVVGPVEPKYSGPPEVPGHSPKGDCDGCLDIDLDGHEALPIAASPSVDAPAAGDDGRRADPSADLGPVWPNGVADLRGPPPMGPAFLAVNWACARGLHAKARHLADRATILLLL